MDDDGPFAAWFRSWLPSRPVITPFGWFKQADLEAAFNAGVLSAEKYVDRLAETLREDIIAEVLAKMAAAQEKD